MTKNKRPTIYLKEYAVKMGFDSVTSLAKRTGVARSVIHPLWDKGVADADPKLSTLANLANELGIPVSSLFQDPNQEPDVDPQGPRFVPLRAVAKAYSLHNSYALEVVAEMGVHVLGKSPDDVTFRFNAEQFDRALDVVGRRHAAERLSAGIVSGCLSDLPWRPLLTNERETVTGSVRYARFPRHREAKRARGQHPEMFIFEFEPNSQIDATGHDGVEWVYTVRGVVQFHVEYRDNTRSPDFDVSTGRYIEFPGRAHHKIEAGSDGALCICVIHSLSSEDR